MASSGPGVVGFCGDLSGLEQYLTQRFQEVPGYVSGTDAMYLSKDGNYHCTCGFDADDLSCSIMYNFLDEDEDGQSAENKQPTVSVESITTIDRNGRPQLFEWCEIYDDGAWDRNSGTHYCELFHADGSTKEHTLNEC